MTSWVMCSNRTPEKSNHEDEPFLVLVRPIKIDIGNNILGGNSNVGETEELFRILADFLEGSWYSLDCTDVSKRVVAWLDGVPEYIAPSSDTSIVDVHN